jgi:isopentenyl-diphosphate delta-isomerase type 1
LTATIEGVEHVVLVNDLNQVIGTMPKSEVHARLTPLHRGFSAFVFDSEDGRLLLQQRSATKLTWPLVWANSCCGHPAAEESNLDAARRRLKYELGATPTFLEEISAYRFCFTRDGVMENEICPILVGFVTRTLAINRDEVQMVRWVAWEQFLADIDHSPELYAEWSIEEARILAMNARFRELVGALQ